MYLHTSTAIINYLCARDQPNCDSHIIIAILILGLVYGLRGVLVSLHPSGLVGGGLRRPRRVPEPPDMLPMTLKSDTDISSRAFRKIDAQAERPLTLRTRLRGAKPRSRDVEMTTPPFYKITIPDARHAKFVATFRECKHVAPHVRTQGAFLHRRD